MPWFRYYSLVRKSALVWAGQGRMLNNKLLRMPFAA